MNAAWQFLKQPVAAGAAVFFSALLIISGLLDFLIPTTCRDGWHSPSIGLRGACSWHGGVYDHGKGAIALLLSIGAALCVGLWRKGIEEKKAKEQRTEKTDAARTSLWLPQPTYFIEKNGRSGGIRTHDP